MAQTKKTGTAQRKPATTQKKSTTPQKKSTTSSSAPFTFTIIDDAEISLKGHIDYMTLNKRDKLFKIDKNIKANYIFKVFRDPTDRTRPDRKTVILTCDIDWRALGLDHDIPMDWSWSSNRIHVVTQDMLGTKGYAVMDGNEGVMGLIPNGKTDDKTGTFLFAYGGGNQFNGLRQGMHIDDIARQLQAEIPGSRIVITGNRRDGLTEYVLQSFGENKVYDFTGDYHYELNNTEPYFTFWVDSKDKLVKWFALKRAR